ncbi:hypothetical protein [Sphingobium sp. YR768]|uniref:hypothetical protein n=1 Tax=Sphingobium sp. YR768 TaxID=1884365 RepID=UPI0008D1DF79|nr:hypothetical protein [Sphingobium sp. YR768]SER79209.1 hypothetical protein SAMN05518866_1196 [Sphingobium sp. YR768]
MAGHGTDQRDVKAWGDQDLVEAFLMIAEADQNSSLDQAVLGEMNRRASGGQHDAATSTERPRLWDYGRDR